MAPTRPPFTKTALFFWLQSAMSWALAWKPLAPMQGRQAPSTNSLPLALSSSPHLSKSLVVPVVPCALSQLHRNSDKMNISGAGMQYQLYLLLERWPSPQILLYPDKIVDKK